MKPSVQRVAAALASAGIACEVREFAASTRTAADAAAMVGATVGQIVKSLVFLADGNPVVLLVSGANRVDETFVGVEISATLSRASAEAVRAATGFAIGGVAPVGLATALPIYCDRDLLQYPTVWAAAGTPNAVFPIAPADLVHVTGARVIAVTP